MEPHKGVSDNAQLLCFRHKTIDDLLLASLLERDGELVAVDFGDFSVAEFLMEYAVFRRKIRRRAGGFRNQLAFNHQ